MGNKQIVANEGSFVYKGINERLAKEMKKLTRLV